MVAVERIAVSTVLHVPPEEAFDEVLNLPDYAHHADYLSSIDMAGDGEVGTTYTLHFAWWKVTFEVSSEVTAVEPPERIGFTLTSGIDGHGEWRIQTEESPTPSSNSRSSLTLDIRYDPSSVAESAIGLPFGISVAWIVRQVRPYLQNELQRIVEQVVADIEGTHRDVDLTIRTE